MKNIRKGKHSKRTIFVMTLLIVSAIIILIPLTAFANLSSYEDFVHALSRRFPDDSSIEVITFENVCKANGIGPNAYNHVLSNFYLVTTVGTIDFLYNGYEGLKVVGIVFTALYFVLTILNSIEKDSFDSDSFVMLLVRTAAVILLIDKGADLFKAIIVLSVTLTNDAGALIEEVVLGLTGGTTMRQIYTMIVESTRLFPRQMLCEDLMLANGLNLFLNDITAILLSWLFMKRLIIVDLRFLFAPLALADTVTTGMRSHGANYIKEFASDCIQVMYIVVIGALIPNVVSVFNSSHPLYIIFSMFAPIVSYNAIKQCEVWADELLGVDRLNSGGALAKNK